MNRLIPRIPMLVPLISSLLLLVTERPLLHAAEPPARATVSAALNVTALQPNQQAVVAVVLDIAKGIHTQSNEPGNEDYIATTVVLDANSAFTAHAAIYPRGEDVTYPALGRLNVYSGRAVIFIPIQMRPDAVAGELKISGSVHYQPCDDSVCFQPTRAPFSLRTTIVPASQAVQPDNADLFATFDPTVFSRLQLSGSGGGSGGASSDSGRDGGFSLGGYRISRTNYLAAFGVALLVGVIFNIMPCVLPVLPLKALGFYEVSQHRRGKAFALGLVFSLGLISVFGLLAVLILVGGQNWGELFSRGWFVWGMTIVLVLFALSTWGLFTFSLPLGVYRFEPRHDTYTGNFLFGGLTALLSTPCTAPIFPALIAWAAAQPRTMGVGVIMMVGVGMALPYLVLSGMPELARKLPRTGPWSELVKQVMGFLILGVAAYFAGLRLLSGNQYMWLVFAVAIVAGLFLIVQTIRMIGRPVPIVVAVVLALLMTGTTYAGAVVLNRKGLWTPYTPEALRAGIDSRRIVLIKFTATWCANCQVVEQTVFPDARAREALGRHDVLTLKADLTREDAIGWPLLKKLSPSGGIPLTAVYAPGAEEPIQLASIYTVNDLLEALAKAAGPPSSKTDRR